MQGQGFARHGCRLSRLDQASFDRERDLFGYGDGLEMTGLVDIVDPPRAESKPAVEDAQRAHIRARTVTGDDVITVSR